MHPELYTFDTVQNADNPWKFYYVLAINGTNNFLQMLQSINPCISLAVGHRLMPFTPC